MRRCKKCFARWNHWRIPPGLESQGALIRLWARSGTRPRIRCHPARGSGAALVMPGQNRGHQQTSGRHQQMRERAAHWARQHRVHAEGQNLGRSVLEDD
jgi:hypothetical protein